MAPGRFLNSYTTVYTNDHESIGDLKKGLLNVAGFTEYNITSHSMRSVLDVGAQIPLTEIMVNDDIDVLKRHLIEIKKMQYRNVLQKLNEQIDKIERY